MNSLDTYLKDEKVKAIKEESDKEVLYNYLEGRRVALNSNEDFEDFVKDVNFISSLYD
jgi:aminoglycoside/choline kinase family phosphotransferase